MGMARNRFDMMGGNNGESQTLGFEGAGGFDGVRFDALAQVGPDTFQLQSSSRRLIRCRPRRMRSQWTTSRMLTVVLSAS